jgi:hypothetical protein
MYAVQMHHRLLATSSGNWLTQMLTCHQQGNTAAAATFRQQQLLRIYSSYHKRCEAICKECCITSSCEHVMRWLLRCVVSTACEVTSCDHITPCTAAAAAAAASLMYCSASSPQNMQINNSEVTSCVAVMQSITVLLPLLLPP